MTITATHFYDGTAGHASSLSDGTITGLVLVLQCLSEICH